MPGNPVYPVSLFGPPLFLACARIEGTANRIAHCKFPSRQNGLPIRRSGILCDGSGFIPILIEPRWIHGMLFDSHDQIP